MTGQTRGGAGFFVAIEGVEGSGKSTQAGLLADHLRARGRRVRLAREPGSTPLGERVRETALGDPHLAVPPRSELFLMLAARAAFVEQVVEPELAAGAIVIADRYELSTFAYQGGGRGLPLEQVRLCNAFATGGLAADATLLFDLPVEEGRRRQAGAGKRPDRMEGAAADFHSRVAAAYRRLADEYPGVIVVAASGNPAAVHRGALAMLEARFPETFPRARVI